MSKKEKEDQRPPKASPSAGRPDRPSLHLREQSSSMKNRTRETWAWLPELSRPAKIPSEVEEEALRLEMGQIQARFMQPGRPPTEAEASSLRLEAEQIMQAEEMLKSSPGRRGKDEFALKKKLREARDSFITSLSVYGLRSYRWPDGFSVHVLPPREEERAGSIRSRLIFDQE